MPTVETSHSIVHLLCERWRTVSINSMGMLSPLIPFNHLRFVPTYYSTRLWMSLDMQRSAFSCPISWSTFPWIILFMKKKSSIIWISLILVDCHASQLDAMPGDLWLTITGRNSPVMMFKVCSQLPTNSDWVWLHHFSPCRSRCPRRWWWLGQSIWSGYTSRRLTLGSNDSCSSSTVCLWILAVVLLAPIPIHCT